MKAHLLAACALVVLASPASAQISDWQVSPYSTLVGSAEFTVGGRASGALFLTDRPGAGDKAGGTGFVMLNPALTRTYDSGFTWGLTANILAYSDHLYTGHNGNDPFQYAYAHIQTGLGRIELGMTEGAAARLANSGPHIISDFSFSDPNQSIFQDPSTDRAFIGVFAPRDRIVSSADFAKISLYTPRLFGVQLGLSFTPSESKQVLPFLNSGAKVADRQQNIWEMAASYSDDLNDVSGITFYGALSLGHNASKTVGHEGLTDWALGLSYDYDIAEDWRVSLGGAYHGSNAYAFNLNNVLASGMTDTATISAAAENGPWKFGIEYVTGAAEGTPNINLHGFQLGATYALMPNFTLGLGWQKLNYSRNAGLFYNASRRIGMDGAFLNLDFHL